MTDNPYASPISDGTSYKSPLPLLQLSEKTLRISGKVPKETALRMVSECVPIGQEKAKRKPGCMRYVWFILALIGGIQLLIAVPQLLFENRFEISSLTAWSPMIASLLLLAMAFLPWVVLYREGRASQEPEKSNPPSWSEVTIELSTDGFTVEREGTEGVTRFSRLDWGWTTISKSGDAWLLSYARHSPLLIPREWIHLPADREAIDQFAQSLEAWQNEPGNLSRSQSLEIPKEWTDEGHLCRVTGTMEYELNKRVSAKIKRKLPKFELVSPNIRWCFFTWMSIIVVAVLVCALAWYLDAPTVSTWCASLLPAGTVAFVSYLTLRRLLLSSQALVLVSEDAVWIANVGAHGRLWLDELPCRFAVKDTLVISTDDGSYAVVLPKESFKDESGWLSVCGQLGVA